MRQTFRAAAVLPGELVRPLASGPPQGHLLKLLFELRRGQAAALEAVARFDDLLDVELEDVAPTVLAVGALAPPEKGPEPAAAFAEREGDLLADLVVLGDRLFRLARERNPDRGHVDEDDHGTGRDRASGLRHSVIAPGGVEHGLVAHTGGLLIEQRHAVRVADHAGELVVVLLRLPLRQRDRLLDLVLRRLLRPLPVGQARLDHEGVATVDGGWPAHGRVEVPFDLLIQAGEDRPFTDRRQAVGRRRHDLRRLNGLVERLGGLPSDLTGTRAGREARGLADVFAEVRRHPAEITGQEPGEGVARRVLEHLQEHPELDAIRVRLDLAWRWRKLVVRPGMLPGFSFGREVPQPDV